MKRLMEQAKNLAQRLARAYMNCMELYGEALYRGGSYGC